MATSVEFINYVCEQVENTGIIRPKKMFGEYMIYVNDKPILLVCNDTVFIKIKDEIDELMKNSSCGFPYTGAKEHYILDVDDKDLCVKVISILEPITPVPKPKKKKEKTS
jgi:Regulator of competence-specific genes